MLRRRLANYSPNRIAISTNFKEKVMRKYKSMQKQLKLDPENEEIGEFLGSDSLRWTRRRTKSCSQQSIPNET